MPRLFLIVFRYGQPLLIRQLIRFVSQPPTHGNNVTEGFWILASAFFVYTGLAVGIYLPMLILVRPCADIC